MFFCLVRRKQVANQNYAAGSLQKLFRDICSQGHNTVFTFYANDTAMNQKRGQNEI